MAAFLLITAFKLQWLFLCRSSLIGLGIMYLLTLLSNMTPLKGLFAGAFDLENFNAGFTVGLLLFFAAWAVTATSDLILDAAATRLNQTLPPLGDCRYLHNIRSLFIVGAVVLQLLWGGATFRLMRPVRSQFYNHTYTPNFAVPRVRTSNRGLPASARAIVFSSTGSASGAVQRPRPRASRYGGRHFCFGKETLGVGTIQSKAAKARPLAHLHRITPSTVSPE